MPSERQGHGPGLAICQTAVRYAAILFIPEDGIDRSELTHLERIHPAGWEENGWEVIEPFSVLPTRPCAECQGGISKFSDAYLCGDCS